MESILRRRLRNRLSLAARLLVLAALPTTLAAQEATPDRWLRSPVLSPDGQSLVFVYRGDLWRVPAAGGDARQLTATPAYETSPQWSPDGRSLAFAADRFGNFDVFVMPAQGGEAQRLTFHSADDTPTGWKPDGRSIYFSSARLDAPQTLIGETSVAELYSVEADGGRAQLELPTPAIGAQPSPDGRYLAYFDQPGFENTWRKHHTSSVARDLWLYDHTTGSHHRLAAHAAEDRQPVFVRGGAALLFLSERAGSFNVFELDLAGGAVSQRTHLGPHPVRFLSAAADGSYAYGYQGEIYVAPPAGEGHQVAIGLAVDRQESAQRTETWTTGATEVALAPEGDEVAFVVRGDIFAASVEHGTTRRLTRTAAQERSLTWAPDGRSLYFAGERDSSWDIFQIRLDRPEEDRFFESTITTEKAVVDGPAEQFQPKLSPDGKQLAYLQDRDALMVRDLASGKDRVMIPAERNYSYADGDIRFDWSPDSRWLAATYYGAQRWIQEIGLVEVATATVTNLSESGYAEGLPKWAADGSALLFVSDREGRRSHGSWGSDADVYAVDVDAVASERARLSVEELERRKEKEKDDDAEDEQGDDGAKDKKAKDGKGGKDTDQSDGKGKDGKSDGKEGKDKKVDPIHFQTEGIHRRLRRLTLISTPIADYALSPDGESLLYLAQVERNWDLYLSKWRTKETVRLAELGDEGFGLSVEFSTDGDLAIVRRGDGRISRFDVSGLAGKSSGLKASAEPLSYRAELTIDRVAERRHLFEHVWRQVQKKFYVADLHGVAWNALKKEYEARIDGLGHPREFAELLSELLGELNASHTGASWRSAMNDGDRTAALGLIYDPDDQGPGLLIAEVIGGGPAELAPALKPGVRITHFDGVEIAADADWAALLNRKDGQRLRVRWQAEGKHGEVVLKPILLREERTLRYERFLDRMAAMTEKLSGGRVGYVHVASMNDASFRRFYRDTLGRNSDKEALVVDTRWNGGGWLHDDLVGFLEARSYVQFQPRGKKLGEYGGEPLMRWNRPSAVLMNEYNYSDGHIFPFAYQSLGLGPLVGMPVAGTGTAVWWETLLDGETTFGIPMVGIRDLKGNYLENLQLEPDVRVENDPESLQAGEDKQLAKAVEVLLSRLPKR